MLLTPADGNELPISVDEAVLVQGSWRSTGCALFSWENSPGVLSAGSLRRPPAVDGDARAGLGDVGGQRVQPEGGGFPEVLYERSCPLCPGQGVFPGAGA